MKSLEQITTDLITYRTVTGRDNQDDVLKLYKYVTSSIPISYKSKIIESNGFNSLVIESSNPSEKPYVILTAHIDVVNGPEHLFTPKIEDGKLIGRGASDMKFAVAVYLKLLNELKHINFKVILTSDEEIGGANGTEHLQSLGEFDNGEVIFLPDAGNNFEIVIAEKGVLHLRITTSGTSSHGSKPWEGRNALDSFITRYSELKTHFKKNDKDNWVNTINLGILSGGDTTNTVPDRAQAYLDIRYTEKYSEQHILDIVYNYFIREEVEIIARGLPFSINKTSSQVLKLESAIKKVTGLTPKYFYDHGGSDARFLTKKAPTLMFKPDSGGHHTNHEWIEIKKLRLYYDVLKVYFSSHQ